MFYPLVVTILNSAYLVSTKHSYIFLWLKNQRFASQNKILFYIM